MNIRHLRNDGLLLLTSAIWGFAFVAQRAGMQFLGPFIFNGIRFALGSLSLVPLIYIRSKLRTRSAHPTGERQGPGIPKAMLGYGVVLGFVLFMGSSLQQIGIVYTTAGKAGFITGLYVVLVPLTGLLWGQKAGWQRWVGVGLALTGLYFLSVTESFTVSRGDLLVLLSAFFWTAHVQLVGRFSPKADAIQLACVQFAVCSVLSLIAGLISEPVKPNMILDAAVPILYGGLCSVGIAYTLQVVAQKKANPTHAAIILSLEGVFAVLGGLLILGELLPPRGILGCVLMLTGMISSQIATRRRPD